MPDRRAALASLLAGVALLGAVLVLAPVPADLGHLVLDAEAGAARARTVAAREAQLGPVDAATGSRTIARYDPERDVTLVVFGCGHQYCSAAVPVRGDARDPLDRGPWLLVPTDRGAPVGLATVVPPFAGDHQSVDRALTTEFRMASAWPPAAAVVLGAVLALGALPFAAGVARPAAVAGAAVAGALAGVLGAANLMLMLIGFALAVVFGAVGLGALAVALARRRPVAFELALALAALAFLATALALDAYFPSFPEV